MSKLQSRLMEINCKRMSEITPEEIGLMTQIIGEFEQALRTYQETKPFKCHADACPCIQEDLSDLHCQCGYKTAEAALAKAEELAEGK